MTLVTVDSSVTGLQYQIYCMAVITIKKSHDCTSGLT